jgi:hypothetical protein
LKILLIRLKDNVHLDDGGMLLLTIMWLQG